MGKIKIIHIHSDPKFVARNLKRYQTEDIDNRVIFLGTAADWPKTVAVTPLLLPKNKTAISKAVTACRAADLVIVYDLTKLKSQLVLQLPKTVPVAWRFFGYELYSRCPEQVFSPATLRAKRKDEPGRLSIMAFKRWVLHLYPHLGPFAKAVKRINFFFGMFEEEYDYLQNLGFQLPQFIPLPLYPDGNAPPKLDQKKPVMLIGNSKNAYNNHLD